jgi:hypothetical protein
MSVTATTSIHEAIAMIVVLYCDYRKMRLP